MATTTSTLERTASADEGNDQTAVQKLREQADAVVQRIQPQIAAVSTYAREEPTKALLISAAAGAALMGLVALMVRSGSSSSVSGRTEKAGRSAMAAVRDAALDLAERAQGMALEALDTTQKRAADAIAAAKKRANDAVGASQKRAGDAADSVTDTLADAWKQVREQAGPMVDKIKPQIDAATSYVKEDPARAALGLAAAGAIVAGLIALARRASDDDDSF